jgi:hypothetical protein
MSRPSFGREGRAFVKTPRRIEGLAPLRLSLAKSATDLVESRDGYLSSDETQGRIPRGSPLGRPRSRCIRSNSTRSNSPLA